MMICMVGSDTVNEKFFIRISVKKSKKALSLANSYMVNNFNDFPSGMVSLFDLLVTGNWHMWMDVSSQP